MRIAFIWPNRVPEYHWGCNQYLTLHFYYSFFLTLFFNTSIWSLPKDLDFCELLQCGPFPWGGILQEQTNPAWVPPWGIFPSRKPTSACGAGFARTLLHCGLSVSCSFFQGTAAYAAVVSCMGCKGRIPSDMVLDGLQRDCFTMLFSMGSSGISVQMCGGGSPLLLWSWSLQKRFPDIFSLISHSCCIQFFTVS